MNLTPAQLAAELNIPKSTVMRLTRDGVITPEIREGRTIRFNLERVRDQLAKRAAKRPKHMIPTI